MPSNEFANTAPPIIFPDCSSMRKYRRKQLLKFGFTGNIADTALVIARDRGNMNKDDFLIAVGEAAQDAVWKTQHPLTHHLAEDDPRRVQYLREYQMSVGRQVLAAIENLARQQHRSLDALAGSNPAADHR
jgi:hypothetical protein